MAALGSEVQSTSTELVSIIEKMKDRRRQLDAAIKKEEDEKKRILRSIAELEAQLGTLDKSLSTKTAARNELDKTITDTSAAFKSIADASRKLLNAAKEESAHLQTSEASQRVMQPQYFQASPAGFATFPTVAPVQQPVVVPAQQDVRVYPEEISEMLQLVQALYRPETREKAILELSKNRDKYTVLGPTLWYSVGVMPIILQEIVSMYPLLNMSSAVLVKAAINRVSSVLTLLQTVAHHDASRKPFLESQMCLFLYPFLRVPPNDRTEVLRLTSLGVIGALVKSDDPVIINYLLNTEIFPLCLKIMEQAVEISKIISTFIVQKLLLSDEGLQYACQTPNRFTAVAEVLHHMVTEKSADGEHVCSTRLLRHIIRCYLRLSENERAREALPQMLPEELRNNTFKQFLDKDPTMKKWLLQLLVSLGDEGAMRVSESARAA